MTRGALLRRGVWTVALLGVLGAATSTAAWARRYQVQRLAAEIVVDEGGTMHVTERITFLFQGGFHGVYRIVPYGVQANWWYRDLIDIRPQDVTLEDGTPLSHDVDRKRGKIRFRIPLPGLMAGRQEPGLPPGWEARRTIVLRYRVVHALRSHTAKDPEFGVYDELYWNATGNAWEVPIAEAEVRVRLPASLAPEDAHASAYTGLYGGRSVDYEVHEDDGALVFRTTRRLLPNEGLTVSVAFPPGHVRLPGGLARLAALARANWTVFLALLAAALWFLRWWLHGRDRLDRSVIPEFAVPDGLRATEAGTLIDDRVDPRDLSAAIVDLGVRGVLAIEGAEQREQMRFRLDRAALEAARLAPWELDFVEDVFGDADEVTMKQLERNFPRKVPTIRRRLLERLVERGLYPARPDLVAARWTAGAVAVLVGLVVLGGVTEAAPVHYVAVLLAAVVMLPLSRFMPRRTRQGLTMLARIRGLEDYVVTAERERMQHMPLAQLESLLPYAVAFGVHERWAKRLDELFGYAPTWYQQGGSGPGWADGLRWMDTSVHRGTRPPSRVEGARSGPGGWGSGWGSGTWSGGSGFGGGGFAAFDQA